jgi:zinc protease
LRRPHLHLKEHMDDTFLQRLPTHERCLDNGLTVIVREDRSAPVVAVVTHVRAGYFDEPDALVGISHVLEHMYFKGTSRRGPGEIARETKEAGGYLNAGTIYDRTSYYTVLPSASLEQALDIQADALQHSAIDAEELRKELLVIIQESKRKLDNPDAVAQETLFETMFDEHRIRRWRIGTEAVLAGFTRQDVLDFYRNFYRAANTTLVIAGDVEAGHAFELAQRYYGAMAAGEPVRDAGADEPPARRFRYREIEGDIAQCYVEWGWRTPAALHADTPALNVLATALGQGRASRLYRHVRDAGAAAAVFAYNYTPTSLGIFGISAEMDAADTTAALTRTAGALVQALADGFTESETERARNILEARMLRRLETMEGQATLIADWQALGDWRLAGQYLHDMMAVTPARLDEVARRYLQPDAATILLYRPRSAPPFADSAERARSLLFDAVRSPEPAAADTTAGPPARGARPAPARLTPSHVEDDVHFYALADGGAHIVIKPRTTVALVSMALYCRGGSLAERDGSAGMTSLMARTSVKGTRQRSGLQLAEAAESLGGSISPGAGADMIDWTMSLPARHFEHGVELLLETALEPSFPEQEAERERKMTLSDLEQLRDDMHQYPLRLALAAAFRGHPYGFDIALLERSIRDADLSLLHDWHRDRVLRGAPHVFVVGDVPDPDAAAAIVARRLAGRLGEPLGLDTPTAGWAGGETRAEQRDKAQTAIALAFPGPARNHADVHALQVLSSAIAGLGGRLFEELRSRRSLAYAVTASPLTRWLGGAFIAYIGTAPEREDEARAALLHELLRTAQEPLPDDDIERARRYLIGSWQIRQQTHARQLADLAWAVLVGRGLAELREYEDRVSAVDAAQIQAAAARWLREDQAVTGIVRGTGGSR